MQMRWNIGLVAIALVWAASNSAVATERHVPTEYGTIQAAIDACVAGDVVIVADGTYTGAGNKDLDFGGKAITVRSASGDPNTCVIDCERSGRGFYFHTDETTAAIVQGLTICNGETTTASPGGDCGGGVNCTGASPTLTCCTITGSLAANGGGLYLQSSWASISNNTIAGNGATSRGGGLYLQSSSPTILNNMITSNYGFAVGGGLYLTYNSSPAISNNMIAGNYASSGGGLCLTHSSAPTISNNTIAGNSGGGLCLFSSSPTIVNNTIASNNASNGGGLQLEASSPTIANNRITGNDASSSGGGLYLTHSSSPMIANNTITTNNAPSGGGLCLTYSSSPTIANTVVAFNSSGIFRSGGSPNLRNNCVYGNAGYNYSGITDPTGTNGNICADPAVAGWTYGGWHLRSDSPCVNAGDNVFVYGGLDLDGQPRIQPVGGTVDIGADESDGTNPPAGPFVVVRVSPLGDDEHDGSSWTLAKHTVQAGIQAASALGGEVWVQAGTYYERIALERFAHVYGGFGGIETARDERNWKALVTILDGQQWGSVVVGKSGYMVSTLDGFTITHGNAITEGGGVYLEFCSPTIANNTIAGNGTSTDGGGLYAVSSFAVITNNTIMCNNASMKGGGLYFAFCSPTISNNTIVYNNAHRGGGLYLSASSATILNNTIVGNYASSECGALYLGSSSPTIANTIVAFNSSGIIGSGGAPKLRNNCVYGNTLYNYSGIADPTGTSGNISADPLFRSPNGPDDDPDAVADNDYRLAPGSPCIDAGSNSAVPADTLDLDGDGNATEPLPFDLAGQPRFVDDLHTPDCPWAPGTCGTAPIVDMGAYEYQMPPYRLGDANCDGAISGDDIGPFVVALHGSAAYEARYPGCWWLNADCNGDGAVSYGDINPFVRLLAGK